MIDDLNKLVEKWNGLMDRRLLRVFIADWLRVLDSLDASDLASLPRKEPVYEWLWTFKDNWGQWVITEKYYTDRKIASYPLLNPQRIDATKRPRDQS